jgi:hypothetical protein
MNSRRQLLVVTVVLIAFVPQISAEISKPYPVRNGDFSVPRLDPDFSRWLAADWKEVVIKGQPIISAERLSGGGFHFRNYDGVATIETKQGDEGGYVQQVALMPGSYVLNASIFAPKSVQASIEIAGKTESITGDNQWQRLSIEFATKTNQKIVLSASGTGKTKFDDVYILIKKLISSPVPMSDDISVGAIITSENPSVAEQFAAYELQNYIYKMTGLVVGLQGRDETFPGKSIVLGKAAGKKTISKLTELEKDSYLIDADDQKIVLVGNTDRGTLYAVYDFLGLQGCGWYMPGDVGEVVPKRDNLIKPDPERIEVPDYTVRGFLAYLHKWYPDGQIEIIHADKYLDWGLRNRMNAAWYGQPRTADFQAHRGYGHKQPMGHTWHTFLSQDHPEWWTLMDGKRQKLHNSGRPNMLCVSNKELRDHVVATVLEYFKNNPDSSVYALSPDDEPANWCECPNCRALDEDQGKGEWVTVRNGVPELSMTPRVMNFVNEVAERVSKVYPDRLVEIYIYGTYRKPPEYVRPNVLVNFCFHPGASLNRPLSDTSIRFNREMVIDCLDGWQKAGTKQFELYDYGEFYHMERPFFWFYSVVENFKTLHDRWGFSHCFSDNLNNAFSNFMYTNLRARTLWDVNIDYKDEIREICTRFYGPAADDMYEYFMFMNDSVMNSYKWRDEEEWAARRLKLLEQPLDRVLEATGILDRALRKVDDDELLKMRVDIARFGHAFLTCYVGESTADITPQMQVEVEKANNLAGRLITELVYKCNIRLYQGSPGKLKSLPFSTKLGKKLYDLNSGWKFRKDPGDRGLREKWFDVGADSDWNPILVTKDWTSQGHDYYGVAWYSVSFQLGVEESKQKEFFDKGGKAALLFGAVDGYADIFLDGKKIGEQKISPNQMWDQEFAIPLPEGFDPALKHSLIVRVEKGGSADAGIWRPVFLIFQKNEVQ